MVFCKDFAIRLRNLLLVLLITTLPVFNFASHAQNELTSRLHPLIPELPPVTWEQAGLNSDSIQNLVDLIGSTPPNDFRAMVVIKDGKLAVEEYFGTYWRTTIHDIRSAGKSITALLAGIAIDQGLVKDIEQPVFSFFGSDRNPEIKIKHLLTMSSGLDADSDDSSTPGQAANWIGQDNWLNEVLKVPTKRAPGKQWVYADVHALLLGAIIEKTSGSSLAEFAEQYLFEPLGIKEYYWFSSPNGETAGMGNLYLSALDFAKIGAVMVYKGTWDGKRIVSESWINSLMTPHFDLSDNNPFADQYTFMWYKSERIVNDRKFEYYFASGNGGNVLIFVPQENMVVSLLSSAYGPGHGHRRSYNILRKILASIK